MRRLAGCGIAAAIIVGLSTVAASAAPVTTTKYQYYNVTGSSAGEIYKTMLRRGPHVNGAKAYAATSAQSSQKGFLVQGQSCKIQDYKFKIDFVIKLPRVAGEKKLPQSVRARWQEFSAFLRKHEETHRSIWIGCAKEFEAKVASLKAGSCDKLDSTAARLWDTIRTACDRKHEAFDNAEQRRLIKHPFVRMVLGKPSAKVKTASVATKKKKKTAAAFAN